MQFFFVFFFFIAGDNILWPYCGISDNTDSLENTSEGCKIDPIQCLAMDIVFPSFLLAFESLINIHEYDNNIIFIYDKVITRFVI